VKPLFAVVVLVLAAAGCGAAAKPNADGRWARAIVLRPADLPTFTAAAPAPGKTCLPAHLDMQTGFGRSQQFTDGGRTVAARAWVFQSQEQASKGFRNLVARDYAACLARGGVAGGRIIGTRQAPFGAATTGDRFHGIHVLVRLAQGGTQFTVFVDLLFLRYGRALADAAFTSTGQPFGNAAETAVISPMSVRMHHPPRA
jgi:hypothetical protein